MSDFHQFGLITTLHQLGSDKTLPQRHRSQLTSSNQSALVLPCHSVDLDTPAFHNILTQLAESSAFHPLLISINGFEEKESPEIIHFLKKYPDLPLTLLLNHHQSIQQVQEQLSLSSLPAGKGYNVWTAIGHLLQSRFQGAITLHDCDIRTYSLDLPLRLAFPVLEKDMHYIFSKGYYHRATTRLFGRVTRLFFAPLLQAIIRLYGHHPLLDFLEAFRYPLSGEISFHSSLAPDLEFAPGYSLETAMLCSTHHLLEPERVCQVDLGLDFDHRHHPVGESPTQKGLTSMCCEIAKTLFHYLQKEGLPLGAEQFPAISQFYLTAAQHAILRSSHICKLNNIPFDASEEHETVNNFSTALTAAFPPASPPPLLPAWNQILSLNPRLPVFPLPTRVLS